MQFPRAGRFFVLRSLQMARQAMQVNQARVDVLANNLANVATSGFRQVLTQVSEVAPAGVDAPGADGLALPAAARRPGGGDALRDLTVDHATDVRRGEVASTGRDSDLALASRGFFVVQDQDGNAFYTRDGNFHRDDAGRLATADGLAVQGTGGPLEIGAGKLEVTRDGQVMVDGATRGRLRVADFAEPSRLEHRGDSLLVAPDDLAAEDVPAAEVQVLQGHLEASNVDPVRTLVDMIAAQRAFEVQAKMLQASDESLQKSVNNLSAVR